jgi:hypothetical protein
MALAEIRRKRTPTVGPVDDGSSDAPRHRMERSGVWLFFIDAKHMVAKRLAPKTFGNKTDGIGAGVMSS